MNSLVVIVLMCIVVFHVGVQSEILSMQVLTGGYTSGHRETTDNSGIKVRMDRYTRGRDCIKVMLIEQSQPLRKLAEITVSCVWENWSVTNSMVNYGDFIHIQTVGNKAVWAVFDLGGRCIQHVYQEKGVYPLGKEETTFNREECDEVVRTQKPYKAPQTPTWQDHNDDEALAGIEEEDGSAVIEMNSNVVGYRFTGTKNKNDNGVSQELVQDYLSKYGECVRVVTLSIQGMEAQAVKIQCSVNGREVNGHYQYGAAFAFRRENVNAFKGLFNLGYGTCIRKTYTVTKGFHQRIMVSPDITTTDKECQDLTSGHDLLGTSGSRSGSHSGIAHSGGTGFANNGPTTPGEEQNEDEDFGEWEQEEDEVEDNEGEWEEEEGEEEKDEGEWEEDEDQEGEWEEDEEEGQWGIEKNDDDDHHHGHVGPIKLSKKPGIKPAETPQSKEDYKVVSKQKVAVLSSNVVGYQKQGNAKTVDGSSYRFTVQKYVKPGTDECFKMVTVRKDGDVKENVKISCEYEEPDKKRGLNLRFEGVIYESLPFTVIYVIKDGSCLSKNYFEYAAAADKQKILTEHDCQELTGRSKKERISGVIPGTEPISAEDFAVMEKQIVAVLKGSVKGFTPEKHQSTYKTASFTVEVQDYVKGSQCVKVVSLKKDDHDQYFEHVKLPCEVTAPVITDDEDIELNFGNLIYVQNRVSVVYVIEDGVCLDRSYYVSMDQVKYNERTMDLPECYALTRWREDQRSSSEKLNQQPPPKTLEAPGLMWMLSLNGNPESDFEGNAGSSQIGGETFSLEFQEFVNQERCVRKVTLKIQGVAADKFLVSCGRTKNMNIIGDKAQYGKAFLIVPGPSPNTFVARFNLRERSCVKKTYTVKKGNPVKIVKSKNGRINDKECKGLMQGTVLVNTMGSTGGGSGMKTSAGRRGKGNTVIMGDGMTVTNVGPDDHVVM